MRKTTIVLTGLLLPLAVLACGETGTQEEGGMEETGQESMASDTMASDEMAGTEAGATVALSARGESGVSGDARLEPAGDSIRVALSLTGLTEGQSYPAHVHNGSCESGGGVAQPLTPVTGQAGGTGSSTSTLAASVLGDTTHFIQVHGQGGTPVACGDLPDVSAWQGGMSGGDSMSGGSGSGG
mgnify:CR=1 FL=1